MPLSLKFQQLLTTLVGLPSVSCTDARFDMSNRAVIDQLAEWFGALGFRCEILELPDNGKTGKRGKANLIATKGSGPGGLVLAGHTDTVPFDRQLWQSDPLKLSERDGRLYGIGATDMKGFFPVVIEALRALGDFEPKQPLIILATADEESSMDGARELARLGRPKARYAVIGEPTGLKPIRLHKGIMMEGLRVHGAAGHSSDPALGKNAIDIMHEVITVMMSLRNDLQREFHNGAFAIEVPTLNLGCIHGGDNPNRICSQCELHFDLRGLPGMHNDSIRQRIRDLVAPIATAHQTTIELFSLIDGVQPFEQSPTSDIVRLAQQLTGHEAGSVAFATEAPFLQQLGMETIVLGPGSINQAHQVDEFLALDQIQPGIDIVRQLIVKLCG
jgi:acetylornithine deacetylase